MVICVFAFLHNCLSFKLKGKLKSKCHNGFATRYIVYTLFVSLLESMIDLTTHLVTEYDTLCLFECTDLSYPKSYRDEVEHADACISYVYE